MAMSLKMRNAIIRASTFTEDEVLSYLDEFIEEYGDRVSTAPRYPKICFRILSRKMLGENWHLYRAILHRAPQIDSSLFNTRYKDNVVCKINAYYMAKRILTDIASTEQIYKFINNMCSDDMLLTLYTVGNDCRNLIFDFIKNPIPDKLKDVQIAESIMSILGMSDWNMNRCIVETFGSWEGIWISSKRYKWDIHVHGATNESVEIFDQRLL